MIFLTSIFKFLTGGFLGRALDTVDKRIEVEGNRDKIKGDIIMAHQASRASWMQSGGFWTLLGWNVLAWFHYGAVTVYSVFWCQGCAYPVLWTIAALPEPLATYEGYIILAGIGGLGLATWRK